MGLPLDAQSSAAPNRVWASIRECNPAPSRTRNVRTGARVQYEGTGLDPRVLAPRP
ncbi:hypothetical protein ACFFRL_02620 [Agromyces hippuratus]|uniref:hypothetical protein n=1 Tax=Agromyces hippuratus TaxID=286438 RepID=UPI0035EA36B5